MLKCNYRHWLADAKINTMLDAQKKTGLSRNTLIKFRDEIDLESAELGTLIQLCNAFNRPLSELIEYVPEK